MGGPTLKKNPVLERGPPRFFFLGNFFPKRGPKGGFFPKRQFPGGFQKRFLKRGVSMGKGKKGTLGGIAGDDVVKGARPPGPEGGAPGAPKFLGKRGEFGKKKF